jgi:hypothetical protein
MMKIDRESCGNCFKEKEEGWGRMMVGVNLIRYIASTYVNVTMKSSYTTNMLIKIV